MTTQSFVTNLLQDSHFGQLSGQTLSTDKEEEVNAVQVLTSPDR